MAGLRKRCSAYFTAKVGLEAIRRKLTIALLASKHGVHLTLIHGWKKQALEGMAGVFSAKTGAPASIGANARKQFGDTFQVQPTASEQSVNSARYFLALFGAGGTGFGASLADGMMLGMLAAFLFTVPANRFGDLCYSGQMGRTGTG